MKFWMAIPYRPHQFFAPTLDVGHCVSEYGIRPRLIATVGARIFSPTVESRAEVIPLYGIVPRKKGPSYLTHGFREIVCGIKQLAAESIFRPASQPFATIDYFRRKIAKTLVVAPRTQISRASFPAKAATQEKQRALHPWIPAFAGKKQVRRSALENSIGHTAGSATDD